MKFRPTRHVFAILACCLITAGSALSQASSISTRGATYRQSTDTGRILDIRERLVELALQNPTYEIADHQVTVSEYQIRLAKSAWLAILTASANANQFTIANKLFGDNNTATASAVNYYPLYNFGLTIPFDILGRTHNSVKIARQNLLIAQAQRNDRYRQIKAEVLTKYEDYLLALQMLDLQNSVTQDEFTLYKRAEKDFQDGIVKLEDFDRAYKSWLIEQTKKLTLQRNLNVVKIEIERMIGVKFDDVLQQIKH
jgi:outer membrane protein TolC